MLTLEPRADLGSVEVARAHRQNLEDSLATLWEPRVEAYLAYVREEIIDTRHVNAGFLQDAYREMVAEPVLAEIDGPRAGLEPIEELITSDTLPDEIYETASETLAVVPDDELREVLEVILAFDTPSAELVSLSAAGFEAIARIAGKGALGIAIGAAADTTAPYVTRVLKEKGPRWARRLRNKINSAATAADNAITEVQLRTTRGYSRKRWVALNDDRTRDPHSEAHGQTVPLGSSFTVGGFAMSGPGDTLAPIELWINCRCSLVGTR